MRKYKVLVVDDEQLNADGVAKFVEQSNLNIGVVGVFYSSTKALEFMQGQEVDIVITDLKMPKLSGIELIQAIQLINPKVRFIILTGYGDYNYATQAMELGIKYFLQKPSSAQQIISVLSSVIEDCDELATNLRLAKKNQIDQIIGNDSSDEVFDENFYFMLYRTEYHQLIKPVIEKLLNSYQIEFSLSSFYDVNCYYLFSNQFNPKIFRELEGIQLSQQFIIVLTANLKHKKIRPILLEVLQKLKLSFYFNQVKLLYLPDIEAPRLEEKMAINIMTKQIVENLEAYEFDETIKSIVELIHYAKNNLMAPPRLKQILVKILEPSIEQSENQALVIAQIEQANSRQQLEIIIRQIIEQASHSVSITTDKHKISDNLNLIINRYYQKSDLSLRWISKNILFLSPEYLGKIYQKEKGMKFTEKLLAIRMKKANELLKAGYKIYEVADRVGFANNPDYFSKQFKKYFGISPTKLIY
ncbi:MULTISPECIES: response regulator [unclassified Enterococcus]|uniref:response regulator transcription factor n=1 Tax=unclassified Enterococcus TaxID=2608891 RepID=UPI001556B192|nr:MULTISPECIES: response regulator [unclassified Enterococcus]MBS7578161.1 response regulator [Enterococcus sp. MMGLQ5-2]MBS7584023.1 response regulator [Enterococcus sp. MMGLQ5-1]NPD11884.1 response regulator [Enterococcus sp. MMGLQ5-1]NPD37992.1 response regulator [Enterococcus sp. MMGLQ5-2]